MTTINDYFEQAQLSLAAYGAGFIQGMFGGSSPGAPSDYAKLLIDAGMSEIQAIDFANTYTGIKGVSIALS